MHGCKPTPFSTLTLAYVNEKSNRLAVGDQIEVEIGNVAHGGHFIARHEGQVIFVRHGITGERALIEITQVTSKIARADVMKVLEASPARVEAPCKYAKPELCGGCDFQHIDLAFQRELKRRVVVEQFKRIGGLDIEIDIKDVPPADGLHWRTRMDFAVSPQGKMGLFSSRSNEVIELDDCLIASAKMNLPELTTRIWKGSDRVEVAVSSTGERSVMRGGRSISGATELHEKVLDNSYSCSPVTFWQSHKSAPSTLVKTALDWLGAKPGDITCDLYGGAGLFTAQLSKQVGENGKVHLVELDRNAIHDARGIFKVTKNVEIHQGRVEVELKKISQNSNTKNAKLDLILLDPPRTGAGSEVIASMVKAGPRKIVYVSCDPASLARDAKELVAAGYEIGQIVGYDLFPMTSHVECITEFNKR